MPAVSIIIPNYNHARYLRRRIDSVLAQTYSDFEVILLDDGSTDQSRKIIESYAGNPKVRIEFNAQNSGSVFKQWNRGVQMARGRYIWIAESDDCAEARFLERMVPILDGQPDVTFAYCRSWRVGENDGRNGFADAEFERLDSKHWTADFIAEGAEELRNYFTVSAPISNTSAVIFRKNIYEAIGGADESLRMCGDYKMWAAMAAKGKIAYIAEPLNYYRSHRENVRTRTEADALGVAEYFHVMLWVVNHVAPAGTLPQEHTIKDILCLPPLKMAAGERIEAAKRSLSCIADWNLRHNKQIPDIALRGYFMDWKFALAGQEFAISPPDRWQFFLHRWRFYRQYFPTMNWKLRVVNLMKLLGAPVVGYANRQWPEEAYARITRILHAR
jgi:hypothetical protein